MELAKVLCLCLRCKPIAEKTLTPIRLHETCDEAYSVTSEHLVSKSFDLAKSLSSCLRAHAELRKKRGSVATDADGRSS